MVLNLEVAKKELNIIGCFTLLSDVVVFCYSVVEKGCILDLHAGQATKRPVFSSTMGTHTFILHAPPQGMSI